MSRALKKHPRTLSETTARAPFLHHRDYLLTAHVADLEKGGSNHQNVEGKGESNSLDFAKIWE